MPRLITGLIRRHTSRDAPRRPLLDGIKSMARYSFYRRGLGPFGSCPPSELFSGPPREHTAASRSSRELNS